METAIIVYSSLGGCQMSLDAGSIINKTSDFNHARQANIIVSVDQRRIRGPTAYWSCTTRALGQSIPQIGRG